MENYIGKKRKKSKKAIFFSIDALIALIIILFSILVIYPITKSQPHESDVLGDIIKVLSSLKIGEINNSYVQQDLIPNGKIQDLDKSVLEQIGEFCVTNITIAKNLADSVLSTINTNENIGLWYSNDLIASRNSTALEGAKDVQVERQFISGIRDPLTAGEEATGFSARAYLTSALQKKYFYFGGYVGDGNISVNINYTGTLEGVELEIAPSRDFYIYVNGAKLPGYFENSSSPFIPKKYSLNSYKSYFSPGKNTMKFVGVGGNLYVAGGYIRITYEDSAQYEQATRYYFPGIEGLINIYDGFNVPGTLNEMEVSLHFKSNYTMFLNIGNVTVFNKSSSIATTETISNADLISKGLVYSSLSNKTIPIRLGLENVSYAVLSNADIFSVAELSGSVNQNVYGKKMLQWIQEGNEAFILAILNGSGNKVGLVAYDRDANDETRNHNLSTNLPSLNNTIYSWSGGRPTCICCGINKAVEKFLADWNASKYHAMVIMSDGKANYDCGSGDAKKDAIQAACNAYNLYGIKVNVIGYGPTTTIDNETLINMSICGHGTYYYSNATELADKYKQAAKDIIEAAYKEQTITIIGNVFTVLYPDSYIKFNYVKESFPYGLITTSEKQFDNSYAGNFSISADSKILETKIVSYSGPRWTDSVKINDILVYKLSDYGSDYIKLGDPYAINIPNSLISVPALNIINLTTGVSPTNISTGSNYNKIIYTLVKNVSSYSPIVASAEGCFWHIQFEDIPTIIIEIPSGYSGADNCHYNPGQHQQLENSVENTEDAIQIAVYELLKLLDNDNNGKIDVNFVQQDLQIDFTEITGIPYAWSTEVQVRKWS